MSHPTLKTQPTPEELEAMDRDLSFHPSTVANPQSLSPAQIEAYNRDGYIKGIPLFSQEEIADHRAFFDDLMERVLAAGGNSYSVRSAHVQFQRTYDTLTHPRIVACVQDILGDQVVGIAAQYFCKMPGDLKTIAWHQDASYWPLSPSKTVTVWLAIDDADVDNACMRFMAGSHHHGHLTYRMSEEAEQNVLNQTVIDAQQFGTEVAVELPAGQISMHSDLLLHSSHGNHSNRRRCGLTLRYCTPDVRALPGYGWEREGVLISGTDPQGNWTNPPRPERDVEITPESLVQMPGFAKKD
ncbi:MAG: phytanoyl-CoA dioxygenase family protein [Candidatus Latescibacteria bacterium]|nr:phytanoyl-CoA dioxygenase family protein [Candidatus Latescibacterota bacterium]